VTAARPLGALRGMILVGELGLHFTRDGDHWRCVEWPGLTMRGDRYEVEGQGFSSLAEVLRHVANEVEASGQNKSSCDRDL